MAKIIYPDFKLEKNTSDNLSFILTNKKGSYLSLSENPESRYNGFFYFTNNKMYRVIENINLPNNNKINQFKNNLYSIERKTNNIAETFFVPSDYNSFVYEFIRYTGYIKINF